MDKIERLIREAKTTMKDRGHSPDRAYHFRPNCAEIYCLHCPAVAMVQSKPIYATTVEIGGTAVATNCNPPIENGKGEQPFETSPGGY